MIFTVSREIFSANLKKCNMQLTIWLRVKFLPWNCNPATTEMEVRTNSDSYFQERSTQVIISLYNYDTLSSRQVRRIKKIIK